MFYLIFDVLQASALTCTKSHFFSYIFINTSRFFNFSVNGVMVKGEKKTAVAKMIKKAGKKVKIGFNVLHADPQQVCVLTHA